MFCRPALSNRLTVGEACGQLAERDRLDTRIIGHSLVLELQGPALMLAEITQADPGAVDLEETLEERLFGGELRDVDPPGSSRHCLVLTPDSNAFGRGGGHLVLPG